MKIINLLNKIANGEEVPKKIKFHGKYYTWYDNGYTGNEGYCLEPLKSDSNSFLEINTVYDLNKEVETIEENSKIKKIEKLDYTKNDIAWCEGNMKTDEDMVEIMIEIKNKINEIIDKLNSIGDENE